MDLRKHLHQLLEELPEPELPAAQRFLEYLQTVQDDVDREPLSEEALAAANDGVEAIQRGDYVTLDEYRRTRGV